MYIRISRITFVAVLPLEVPGNSDTKEYIVRAIDDFSVDFETMRGYVRQYVHFSGETEQELNYPVRRLYNELCVHLPMTLALQVVAISWHPCKRPFILACRIQPAKMRFTNSTDQISDASIVECVIAF